MEWVHTWDRTGLAEDNTETVTFGSEESHEDRRKDWQLLHVNNLPSSPGIFYEQYTRAISCTTYAGGGGDLTLRH